jgi:SM-20-related protein
MNTVSTELVNLQQVEKKIIESKIVIIDNVFSPTELEAIIYLAEKWQHRFKESQTGDDNTSTLDKKKRDSLVLFEFEPTYSFFKLNLLKYKTTLKEQFNYTIDLNKGYESQMTAHNDGHFYTAHTDFLSNTGTRVSDRQLTFVYYFHKEPKGFSGGELFLWDHYDDNVEPKLRAPQGKLIEPKNNRIVFFDSTLWHEVRPITCPSNEFSDSRFTINGWLHF